ncbi:hypothetical protein [Chitinophaga pinensis]|uniref:Uncharacterized protein n=1 Tax=Chitinophaga pinensis (strain ATCC 43595 / DSM 2588 / LMG 13176 / NBRC 15968 / NCIMB 11800 / UQM 2034) TaxID=485918 RepID=A0A979G9J0_CHIPD|nr:hypothetical protein [Chitinophaga pinensis]ACU63419.1 conserved hypothetical protein [Chitinophaga pinensis DSM 2588]
MSYYIRILGTENPDIHLDDILEALDQDGLNAQLDALKNEKPEKWTHIELKNEDNKRLAVIERDAVTAEGMGKEELDEFRASILDFQPASAAKWLNDFFDRVQVIYAFRLLPMAMEDDNYDIITTVQTCIWEKVKGILQADEEGFTNEEGYHILWQFPDDADGEWNCAVLNADGKWENFSMDLANKEQQKAFKQGQVPAGAQKR